MIQKNKNLKIAGNKRIIKSIINKITWKRKIAKIRIIKLNLTGDEWIREHIIIRNNRLKLNFIALMKC